MRRTALPIVRQPEPSQSLEQIARDKGTAAARERHASALIPIEYHAKQEQADAWLAAFTAERKRLAIEEDREAAELFGEAPC